MSKVTDKVVFITGGARGVGAEAARRLHAKGAKLVLTDLDEPPLHDLAGDLTSERLLTLVVDVRDFEGMQAAVSRAIDRFGGIDVVMANAGIVTMGSVLQVDPQAVKTLMDVNVMGVFNTVRAALPAVIDRRGYVLIVSSLAAYAAVPGLAPYNAAKAAVEHFANALRLEVAYRGVDVGSAHMSWIDTPLSKTTSVEACGEAFVKGIEARKRQINCPGWVGLFRWLRPLLASPVRESQTLKFVPDLMPRMDAEVAALGRSTSAR
jgi:NAD(P)-dependent dehydrogenase (short-subunit alcohol dehydrogenase family)